MELAPIVIFVYNRADNLKNTIEALSKNPEARYSELYIFSDGAKDKKDNINVQKVREYIRTVSGFKKVEIYESKKNNGLANSVISGVNSIINKYGRVIVLEDDIITSTTFLSFMNECLDVYSKRKDIWSISGYSPTIKLPSSFNDDVFINIRGASWGWATWKDRWESINWDIPDAEEFLKNKESVIEFNKAGNDLSKMLYEYLHKRIDSWAIRWYYAQFKQSKYTVFPIKSLITNSGFNCNGTHGANKRLANELNTKAYNFKPEINMNVEIDFKINERIKELYDIDLYRRCIFLLRKYGGYWIIKIIKNLKRKFKNKFKCKGNY